MDGSHYNDHIVMIITQIAFEALLSDPIGTSSQGIKILS